MLDCVNDFCELHKIIMFRINPLAPEVRLYNI
jgi:hypothetical protein